MLQSIKQRDVSIRTLEHVFNAAISHWDRMTHGHELRWNSIFVLVFLGLQVAGQYSYSAFCIWSSGWI